jgi:SAM-dependent methyltransferase
VLPDDDDAELYDLMYPWDPDRHPVDRFYHELVMAADSVLDVGCGTGRMLAFARQNGHHGRLAGIDPDLAMLSRARRFTGIEWREGRADAIPWRGEFSLATMTGHAFQCLVGDDDVRVSLAAIHTALRDGGRFVFETRHPQARAWEDWNPSNASDITGPGGRPLRVWHEVEDAAGDLVTFTETTAEPEGKVLHVGRTTLRFLDAGALGTFLAGAGFRLEAQYGDGDRSPLSPASREIIVVAQK